MNEQRTPQKQKSPSKHIFKLIFWVVLGLYLLIMGKKLLLILKSKKFLMSCVSLLLSIATYKLFFKWQFAVGFVILLLIHELGHVLAAKIKGLPVSAPLFIPFLGALITMKRNPRDAETEAFIAIGGPVIGTLGALVFLWVGLLMGSELFVQLAFVGLFLNLINLIPIHPLDGGRISVAVSRWLWLVGLVGGLILIVFVLKSFLFFPIWALFALDLFIKFILNRKHQRSLRASAMFRATIDPVFMPDWFVPGEEHRRELPWRTYSTLDGQQVVEFDWEGIGLSDKLQLQAQMLIERVHVTDIRHIREGDTLLAIEVWVTADGKQWENERYYEVRPSIRALYGASYAALAVLIGGVMMWITALSNVI